MNIESKTSIHCDNTRFIYTPMTKTPVFLKISGDIIDFLFIQIILFSLFQLIETYLFEKQVELHKRENFFYILGLSLSHKV